VSNLLVDIIDRWFDSLLNILNNSFVRKLSARCVISLPKLCFVDAK
jgi:hypothetical protein